MLIYPAIDLIGGRCVRLLKGDFNQATFYKLAPGNVLSAYKNTGAEWAHLVDLDGAREGSVQQTALLQSLVKSTNLKIQAAGGIRSINDVAALIDAGVSRVVIGSSAVEKPEEVNDWIDAFGADHITLAFDVRMIDGAPRVAIKGWREDTELTLFDALENYPKGRIRHVMITNIDRDGAMSGPDDALYKTVRDRRPDIQLQASGGVRNLNDIYTLKSAGAAGAIIGRAIFEGKLDLKGAIDAGA